MGYATGSPTHYELDAALDALVIESQRKFFVQLRYELSHCLRVSDKPLARLCPFIDTSSVIRCCHMTVSIRYY